MAIRKKIRLISKDGYCEIDFVFCRPGRYRVSNLPLLASKNSVVEFSRGYWMQEIPVSLELYEFVCKKPYFEIGQYSQLGKYEKKLFPWFGMDFREVKDFLSKINKIVSANNYPFFYDIPSVSEWEHALLTGKDETWSWGHSDDEIQNYAWYRGNSDSKIHESRQKKCNDWGLFDMYGNVYEYCYNPVLEDKLSHYLDPIVEHPTEEDTLPCLGGCFDSTPFECQAVRFIGYQNEFIEPIGIRLIERMYYPPPKKMSCPEIG